VLSVLPQARWERFGVVEPLAAVLSVLRQARCERFDVVEPLASALSPKAAARSSFVKARFEHVEDLCERGGTLRVEAGDRCVVWQALPAGAVVRSAWPPTLSSSRGSVSPFLGLSRDSVVAVRDSGLHA
jgi:hypothetical protein